MKCMYCKGNLLVLDKVPALVCQQCGEVYFGEAEVDSIQAATLAIDAQVDKIAVPA